MRAGTIRGVTSTTTWSRFLSAALAERDWTGADLIRKSRDRLDAGLVSRWLSGEATPQIPNIRTVCRALGVPAIEGMIAAGRLEPDDVGVTFIRQRTRAGDLSARELGEEVTRRLHVAESITNTDSDQSSAPSPFVTDMGQEGKNWAARRRKGNETDRPE